MKLESFEALLQKGSSTNIHQGVFYNKFRPTDDKKTINSLKNKIIPFQPDFEDSDFILPVNKQKFKKAVLNNPNNDKYYPI
jgi:hypothetical protein